MASSSSRSSSRSSLRPPVRLCCIRFTLFMLVVGLTAVSIYFSYTLTSLTAQVQQEQLIIESLQSQVSEQSNIISRFNASVTNADVEKQVSLLESSLQESQHDMETSLQETTEHIDILLNATVNKLDQTVKAAQAEIQYEVDLVKNDVQSYVQTTQDQFSTENHFMVYQLAGTFTLLACLISMWHITAHFRQFKRPHVQRKVLAILWMSPIYSVTSWLSLTFPQFEGYLAIIKDFYEAYIIYQFLAFLLAVLGRGDRDAVVDLLARHADHLDPPMRLFGWCRGKYQYGTPQSLASAVLLQCQIFAMQFVFFKPMTAVGLFTCNKLHYYGYGTNSNSYESPQFWLRIIQNISVFVAFSGLLKFYHAVQDDLAWCRPFPKFLCIKGIVFMTFWQGLVIGFLANATNMAGGNNNNPDQSNSSDNGETSQETWGIEAQNFIICLEMLFFSIAHFYCFPTDEWQEGYRPRQEKKLGGFGDNMALGDFVADLKLIMRGSQTKNSQTKKKKSDGKSLEDDMTKANDPTTTAANVDDGGADDDDDDDVDVEATETEDHETTNLQKSITQTPKSPEISEDEDDDDDDNNNEEEVDDDDDNEDDDDNKDDDEDDDDFSYDDVQNDDTLDEEQVEEFVSSSILNSLDAPNEEVRQAANRLLRHRTSAMIINAGNPNMIQEEEEEEDVEGVGNDEEEGIGVYEYGSTMSPMGGYVDGNVNDNVDGNDDDDNGNENGVVDETTSLLSQSGGSNSSLRPSIFTMGAMNNFG